MPSIFGRSYPDKAIDYHKVVPNASADDLAVKDCWLQQIRFCNNTALAITVTLQDKQGTPLERYKSFSVAANDVSLESPLVPLEFKGGADIQASAAGLVADIVGYVVG